MAQREPLTVRVDDTDRERIARFQAARGVDDQSEALRQMIEVAHREAKSPLLYRLKDKCIEAGFYLTLVAVISVVAGYTTPVFRPTVGMLIAIMLIAIAMGLLGLVELARGLNGQSEIVSVVRGFRQ